MSKKRSQRRQPARRATRADQVARDAARRERHARLVAERAGDPRFVQRVRTPDSVGVELTPEVTDRVQVVMEVQRRRFRETFGRDMGSEDPVFFDPEADEPQPWNREIMSATLLAGLGEDTPAVVRAQLETFTEIGYLVTEDTRHTFSYEEINAFEACYRRRLAANGVETADVDEDDDAQDIHDDVELPFAAVTDMASNALEVCTAVTLAERTLEAADRLDELIASPDEPDADGPGMFSLVFGVFLSWMIGARESQLVDPDEVMAWIADAFGHDFAVRIVPLVALLAPDQVAELGEMTVNDVIGSLGPDLVQGIAALCAAVAATAGDGDAHWLRKFDQDAG